MIVESSTLQKWARLPSKEDSGEPQVLLFTIYVEQKPEWVSILLSDANLQERLLNIR